MIASTNYKRTLTLTAHDSGKADPFSGKVQPRTIRADAPLRPGDDCYYLEKTVFNRVRVVATYVRRIYFDGFYWGIRTGSGAEYLIKDFNKHFFPTLEKAREVAEKQSRLRRIKVKDRP